MKFFIKKLIILGLAFLIFFNSSGLLTLKPAPVNKAAGVTVVTCTNCATWAQQLTSFARDVAHYAWEGFKWLEQKLGLKLRDIIAKKIIDYIVDQTVTWVQNGGELKFVTDWQGFLKHAGNIAFDQVIKDVNLAWLCQPFSFQVRFSLLPLPVSKFPQRLDCTLDDVVKNIENFYDDFKEGGWIAYNEIWQPQNNYYGQIIMIHDEMLTRMAAKTEAAKNEALAGKGFLSFKKCVDYDDNEGKCFKEEIVTPGSIVGEAVATGVTSDTYWAANIHSWTAALVNAVINRLIKEGLSAMKSLSEPETAGSSDYAPYYPSEYQETQKQDFEKTKNDLTDNFNKFSAALNKMITLEEKSLSLSKDLLNTYKEIKDNNCTSKIYGDGFFYVNEIPNLQNEIPNLESEINETSSTIAKYKDLADELAKQIKGLDSLDITKEPVDVESLYLALGQFENFFNSHSGFFIDLTETHQSENAVQEEIQEKETKLANATSQLNKCLASQTQASSTPESPYSY